MTAVGYREVNMHKVFIFQKLIPFLLPAWPMWMFGPYPWSSFFFSAGKYKRHQEKSFTSSRHQETRAKCNLEELRKTVSVNIQVNWHVWIRSSALHHIRYVHSSHFLWTCRYKECEKLFVPVYSVRRQHTKVHQSEPNEKRQLTQEVFPCHRSLVSWNHSLQVPLERYQAERWDSPLLNLRLCFFGQVRCCLKWRRSSILRSCS